MTFYNVMKLLHIVAAVWFAGGLFARQLVRGYAKKTDDVVRFATVWQAASQIENRMVRPGSIVVLALGVIQARLGGIPIFGSLSGGDQNSLLASMVLYGAVFVMVPLVFLPKGRVFRPVLQTALAEGRITADLRRAVDDPVVALAHRVEEVATLAVFALMVLKPF